ncbi:hypothetical protein MPOCJGCO_2527 [Methylobacterium trifolii]|uniref:Uncharacterized protein n=1 Tax=Methylobacterium trifolii TaxID=1003092 RepID=A0ABQ4TYS8_9HYPH|nr:hypothetical protein MPOCJGCO_2527 [Methylobacterium trifolii]
MGAGADPGILAVAPVEQVVARLGAGAGVVRDLVGREPRRPADILRHVVEGARDLVVRRHQPAGRRQPEERRAGLDGELVEGQVLGRPRDRIRQLGPPRRRRLAGAGVDQVEGGAGERRLRDPDRLERLRGAVQAPERLQRGVVERLDAERHPVDPGGPVAAKTPRLDAGGVGLQGDLGLGRHRPGRGHRLQQARHRLRPHQRGRAAAEEDAGDGPPRRAGGHVRDLGPEGGQVARLVHGGVADVAVEVAIGALRGAEGPVQVDAEARVAGRMVGAGRFHDGWDVRARRPNGNQPGRRRQARAKSTKARARCERALPLCQSTPCFSSAVISPKVRACPSGRKIGS